MGSYKSFRIYKDSWKSDTSMVVNVPVVQTPVTPGMWLDESTISTQYADYFSYDFTLLNYDKSTYTSTSFTSVLSFIKGTYETWYFTENNYIKTDGYKIEYYKEDTLSGSISAVGAKFLFSFNPEDENAKTQMCYASRSGWQLKSSNAQMYSFYADAEEVDSDPYSPGGASGTGGGTGTFSGTGDSIDFPGLPTLSAVSTGFITLFNPSIAQMQSLANYMWSDLFDLDTFKKIFADPMDCILGLSIVPVAVPNGGTAEVKVGNISTGVSMTVASTQYVEVDCGTLNVKEYWGSYLDYDPYTKAEIYLPYCGTHPIAVDDIMGKSVHVKYHVDILSGACVAYVKCGSSVLYSFIGQCTSSIPITGNDWTNVVNGAISIASAIGSMVATGGATAPLVMPGVASTAVNSLKPSVEKSGSMSGTGGMLAVQTPYLILTRPRQALPKNQNTYTGYPSFIKEKLSDLKGYTEVAEIRLSGVDATDAELDEIVSLLKGGVII